MRLFNQCSVNHSAVLQHIIKVHEATVHNVLKEIILVMEMNDAMFVCVFNIFRKQKPVRNVAVYFASDIIALCRSNLWILVTIFLNYGFVTTIYDSKDFTVRCIAIPVELTFISVSDIDFGNVVIALLHQGHFDCVLNVLHSDCVSINLKFGIQFTCDSRNHNWREMIHPR